jgi:hypothetical protein
MKARLLSLHPSSLIPHPFFSLLFISSICQLLDVFEESAAATLGAEAMQCSGRRFGPRK